MQKLLIEKTDETAGILLDKHKGVFEISGRSLPEDSAEFFEPVLKWISEYGKDPNESTDFVFRMEYSNTASSKFIHEILLALQRIKNTKVVWWFQEDDEDMEEAGQEFAEQVDIPFEFKSYP
jgi:hypothetical protein